MSEVDRALCRKAAAECIELARATSDRETKQILLTRAQEWLKLAYAEHDAKFEQLVTEFNQQQMELGESPAPRGPMQRQEVQQQQKKAEDEK